MTLRLEEKQAPNEKTGKYSPDYRTNVKLDFFAEPPLNCAEGTETQRYGVNWKRWRVFVAAGAIINRMKYFTAIVHRGEPTEGGFWATCLEVPGANGQGETKEACLANLKEAIQLLLA